MSTPDRPLDAFPDASDEDLAQQTLDGLRAGDGLGQHGFTLMQRVMGRLRHPMLGELGGDLGEAALEYTSRYLVEKGHVLAETLTVKANSPRSVIGLVVTMVTNWLTDQWRKTPFGSVGHSLSQFLSNDRAVFVQCEKQTWWLVGREQGFWDGDVAALVRAANAVAAKPAFWSRPDRPPLTSRPELVAVLTAILEQAGGPLPIGVLTAVCLERFPHAAAPKAAPLPEDVQALDSPAPVEQDAIARAGALQAIADARRIVEELDDASRFIIEHARDLRAIQGHLDLKRAQSYERLGNTKSRLVAAVMLCDDPDAVQACLPDAWLAVTGRPLVSAASDETGDGPSPTDAGAPHDAGGGEW